MVGPGWTVLGPDQRIAVWADAARRLALETLATRQEDWRCGGTWLVGVDALNSDPSGAVPGADFPWDALPLDREALHPAQLSVIRPGYPQPSPSETEPAYRYRLTRDAAHLDGLLLQPGGARLMQEPHRWVLGIALNDCDATASPLVVWDGSHDIMRAALAAALAAHPPENWGTVDLNPAYQDARRQVFANCPRRVLPLTPGQATLLHRHTLHGVAPWQSGAHAPSEGRMIAYFRPQMASVRRWLQDP